MIIKQKEMCVDHRVIFEIENRERGIEKHREAAKTGFSYTGLDSNDVFFVYFWTENEPMKCFLLITSMKRWGELVSCEC